MKSNRKIAYALVSFFLLLTVAFFVVVVPMIQESEAKKPSLPIIGNNQNHHVQPFSFTDQDGKTITEKDVAGKICVVEYFFATCKGMCPKMNENMKLVYDRYKADDRVLILSHTVDPEHDSAAVLKQYGDRFGADARHWKFLTGDKKQLYDMARYSYLINAEQDTTGVSIDKDFIHDKHFVLVDGQGRIRGFYDGLDAEAVKKLNTDIATLLKEKQ
jgi:protein SCO1/2